MCLPEDLSFKCLSGNVSHISSFFFWKQLPPKCDDEAQSKLSIIFSYHVYTKIMMNQKGHKKIQHGSGEQDLE